MSPVWGIELEPEVRKWAESLMPSSFAVVAFNIDRLSEHGAALPLPHTQSLGEGLFELRFDNDRVAQRITFYFPGE